MIRAIDNNAEKIGELCGFQEYDINRIRRTCISKFKDNGYYQGFSLKKIGTRCAIRISSNNDTGWHFMLDCLDPITSTSFFIDNNTSDSLRIINKKKLKDIVRFFIYGDISESSVKCFVSSF